MQKVILSALWVIFFSLSSRAFVEANVFYATDSAKFSSTAASSQMFADVALGFSVDKYKLYSFGWAYSTQAISSKAVTDSTYSSTQMGPRFLWSIDKRHHWVLGISYNLLTSAVLKEGTTTSKLKGSALKFDFGYNFELQENFYFGCRLNYNLANYIEQLDANDTYTKVAYSRTLIYPSASFMWFF